MTREELEAMSDEELIRFEDELLYDNEVTHEWKIRASGGRMLNFALTAALWALYFFLPLNWINTTFKHTNGLISFFWVVGSLILAGVTAGLLWRIIGMRGRMLIRTLIHYWPVSFGLLFAFLAIWKQGGP